jgi:hypothetical protein
MKLQQKIVFRGVVAAAILAVMFVTAACPTRKSIADINRDPARFGNREVGIVGNVVSSWGALGTGLYQIDDGTGRMWVLSNGYGVPSQGAKVAVAGYVQPTFSLAGRSFTTVLKESRRRH